MVSPCLSCDQGDNLTRINLLSAISLQYDIYSRDVHICCCLWNKTTLWHLLCVNRISDEIGTSCSIKVDRTTLII